MPMPGSTTPAAPANTLTELFGAAVARHQAGALVEAERHYRHILTLFPNHAETHGMLAVALFAQGKIGEAILHFERTVALRPDLPGPHEDLARAYMAAGKTELAIQAASSALERGETAKNRALFAHCIKSVLFTADDGRFRRLVLRALLEGWESPRELSNVCISLIKLNPAVSNTIAHAKAIWPARIAAEELSQSSALAAFAQDELLCRLLEYEPVTGVDLERLLTNVRHAILIGATRGTGEEGLLEFYCAVARQCFINEYVFATTEAEAEQARQLRERLEAALTAGDATPALWPVVVAAYFPLHSLAKAELLLGRSWPSSVNAVIVQQVDEPAQERRIAATMPVLTVIDDGVSRLVRQQYESSPYPRWVRPGPPKHLATLDRRPSTQPSDILIAGCGTGLSAVELARQAPNARILAIDLSLASLGYAKRMAHSFGVANLEFAHADILKMGSIGRTFDFIDASGVLHHLADPWAGWRLLSSLLRPGGAMQLGLYSRLARRNIVAARALIAERGYQPIADDIRRCRQEIIASDDRLLKSIVQWKDFFATSECRDLLFHVQEHQVTIPEVNAFLVENKLKFGGFVLEPATLQKFMTRFPEQAALTDLDRWHIFETEAPDTFSSMYLFWVLKSASPSERPQ